MAEPEFRDESKEPKWRSFAVTVFALAMGLAFFVALGIFFPGVWIIGAFLVAFAALHYVLWGWWLSGRIRQQVEADQRERDNGSRS